jgi:peptidoglycan LD-endopeptidase LytH
MNRHLSAVAVLSLLLLACDDLPLPLESPAATPHEAYANSLKKAGLAETALGREWVGAAAAALQSPVPARLPIEEAGFFPSDRPRAIAYRVDLIRGRRLVLEADLAPAAGALLFIDVFLVPAEGGDSLRHLVSADSGIRYLTFEPRRTGSYLVRLQPELLRGGRYRLTLREEPALAFPVSGAADQSIQSGFGAPRDGGVREHHGIDIFAPRGTPVLAVAAGVVSRVRETPRGGRVVWVRDEQRGNNLYYAHLDQQLVENGAMVQIGDTLGLVGNTGNARTTPPHLHFGVYRRGEGPLDPRPWVARVGNRIEPIRADTSVLGQQARTLRPTALRMSPGREANQVRQLPTETIVRIWSARGEWYHARLPDGTTGFVPAADVARASVVLRTIDVPEATVLRADPAIFAAVIDSLSARSLPVYGRFGTSLLVQVDSLFGWIAER